MPTVLSPTANADTANTHRLPHLVQPSGNAGLWPLVEDTKSVRQAAKTPATTSWPARTSGSSTSQTKQWDESEGEATAPSIS